MKSLAIAALLAAQIMVAAQPAFAADFGDDRTASTQRHGAFAGARMRVPLGGPAGQKVRGGLTMAPVLQGRQADGRVRTRFGEGMEFGLSGRDRIALTIGGTPVSQLSRGTGPDGRKMGVSTVGWVAIGVGVVAVTLFAAFVLCRDGEICGSDRDD